MMDYTAIEYIDELEALVQPTFNPSVVPLSVVYSAVEYIDFADAWLNPVVSPTARTL